MQQQLDLDLAKAFKNIQLELAEIDVNFIAMVVGLIKERATFVSDFWGLSHFFFTAPKSYDEKASKKLLKKALLRFLIKLSTLLIPQTILR